MEYTERNAPPPVSDYVHCFWFLRGRFTASDPQVVVADGRLEIILHLAEPFSRIEGGQARRQDDVLVSGQLTTPVHLHGNGAGDVVGIRFRTGAATAVLRLPLSELTDRVESLERVARPLATALRDAASRLALPEERVTALSRVLESFRSSQADRIAAEAVRQFDAPHGARVADVARSLGVTVRTIERRVQDVTGLSPAALRRVTRFRRAFRLLDATPRGAWAAVAHRAGYADQAHLIRDFRQFAGVPPSEFFRAEPDLARAIMGGGG